MKVRLAYRSDIQAILDIANWAADHTAANFAIEHETLDMWNESWETTHEKYPWLVAEEHGVIIGFSKASPHRGRCAYNWTAEVTVYIHPDHHRRGIGNVLYERLISILKGQGYVTLLAGITIPNPASERLHEKYGFKTTAVFHHVGWKFNKWHDVEYRELILTNDDLPPTKIRPVAEVITVELTT